MLTLPPCFLHTEYIERALLQRYFTANRGHLSRTGLRFTVARRHRKPRSQPTPQRKPRIGDTQTPDLRAQKQHKCLRVTRSNVNLLVILAVSNVYQPQSAHLPSLPKNTSLFNVVHPQTTENGVQHVAALPCRSCFPPALEFPPFDSFVFSVSSEKLTDCFVRNPALLQLRSADSCFPPSFFHNSHSFRFLHQFRFSSLPPVSKNAKVIIPITLII